MNQPDDANGERKDAVDRIQQAWLALHPELDVSSIGIVSRIWRIGRHLRSEREKVFAEFRTDGVLVDVLAELRRSGDPYELTAGELRQLSHLTSGGVSQRLARLESQGLIERSVDLVDRRVVNVRLTEKGITLIDGIVATITEREGKLLAVLPDSERAALESQLRRLLGIFE